MNTVWGVPSALTWAATFDPPALLTDGTATLLGAFELHDDIPTLTLYRDGVRMRSNVSARRPHDLTLLPAPPLGTLALWLDDDGTGIQTLFSARLNDAGFSERGAAVVTSGAVIRYASAAMPDGSSWAVWSAPNAGEPTLMASRIDSAGRARSPQPLRVDADYPALAVTNAGNTLLFWLDGDRLDLFRAELTDAGLTMTTALASAPWPRRPADQLIRFDAGIDRTHAYVFWQIRGSSGWPEVWHASGALAAQGMSAAERLTISVADSTAQTGFNHGIAYNAKSAGAGTPVDWAQPARGQNETLPLAAFLDGGVGVLYFKDGSVIAQQTIGRLPRGLIAPPRIAADDERDLTIAWWLPDTPQEAVLYVVDSRR